MNIVMDSNILFSALIKNSKTRKIILDYEGFFLFPSYIFKELQKHFDELLTKSHMNRTDFEKVLQLILHKVIVVPEYTLLNYRDRSIEIVKDLDSNDAVFLACALAYENSIIWSNDKKLKSQSVVKIVNTDEIKEILNKFK